MASNQEKIIKFYNGIKEDDRATGSRASGLEFHYTKKLLREYIRTDADVIELGCGTGYYGMYFSDFCNHYTGIDLSPDNISVFNEKIAASGKTNIRASIGDATNLTGIPNDSFDVVLCLGPMYHLPREERLKVFDECRRIAKADAILAFAYINRLGVYAAGCLDDKWRDLYPGAEADKFTLEDITLGMPPGVFFPTSPEEMQVDAKRKNLEVIKNCGLDFLFAQGVIDGMSEERFALYMKLADKMVDSPSCAGLSDHALMVCKK